MMITKVVSIRSTCNSRPTGAIAVLDKQILSTGYNGSMSGAPHCTEQPDFEGKPYCRRRAEGAPEGDKYNYCSSVHAETNVVARAARKGISLEGSTVYCTLAPCFVCLKLIANAGVQEVWFELDYVSDDPNRDQYWKDITKESPIKVVKRLEPHYDSYSAARVALEYPTSKRRLT